MNAVRMSSTETVAAVVLLRDDGAALLQLRDDKPGLRHAGTWVMPGGHCQPGEPLEAGARRELCEETGYTCDTLHWLMSLEDDQPSGWPVYPLVMFWARYDGVQPLRCFEGQALRFIERQSAGAFAIPDYLLHIWDAAIAASREDVHGRM